MVKGLAAAVQHFQVKVMHAGHSNSCHDYAMRLPDVTEELAVTKLEHDLNVPVSDILKATTHCQIAARKASYALRLQSK